jgi:N-acetyl-gamma-glutamylphosphate reductase
MSRVLIIGATGETGMSIVQGLLASKDYVSQYVLI